MRKPSVPTVADEANELIVATRQSTYGDPIESMTRIGQLWGDLLGIYIPPRTVAHMMILLKVSRDHGPVPARDNEVDICGYALLLQMEREFGEKGGVKDVHEDR